MKKFKDLINGDKLYILEPLSDDIRETKVIRTGRHQKSLTGKVWVIEFLKLSSIAKLTEEKLEDAKKYGSDVTLKIMVEADESMVLVKFPEAHISVTVVSTDENLLKSWIKRPSKEAAEMLKKLKLYR